MNIVVVAGGLSTERDVSFKTGGMVAEALRENGHRVILLDVFMGFGEAEEELGDVFADTDRFSFEVGNIPDTAPDLAKVRAMRKDQSDCFFGPNVIQICRQSDIVFMALHGENGENGKVQAVFDLFGIRYTGSGYLESAIAMNKGVSKQFFQANGIPTPKGVHMTRAERVDDFGRLALRLPVIVKPCCGGSSIGVTIVREAEQLEEALNAAFFWEDELVIEEYIEGREFSVGVIDGIALPVIEIAPIEGFYDYKNKYKPGMTIDTCPAEISEKTAEKLQHYAREVARVIGLDTYSRSDFIMSGQGEIYCLEVNTLPGMTSTSLMPQEAAVLGVSYPQLCERLIESSMKKYQRDGGPLCLYPQEQLCRKSWLSPEHII